MASKSDKAIVYMKLHDVGAAVAAKEFGITTTAIYRRIAYHQKPRCKCCGQLLKTAKAS